MIGNDIISLSSLPYYDKKRRHRYAQKILTHEEYQAWMELGATELDLFKYWALKEAAYKIWNRDTGKRVFNPKSFAVSSPSLNEKVIVQAPTTTYYGKLTVTEHYIYAVLTESGHPSSNTQSIIDRIGSIRLTDLSIIKIQGLPFLKMNGELTPISVSHCGEWEAVAWPGVGTPGAGSVPSMHDIK